MDAREAQGFGNVEVFQPTPLRKGLVEIRKSSGKLKDPLVLKEGQTIHKTFGRGVFGPHFLSHLEKTRGEKREWDDAPAFQTICEERRVIGKILEGVAFDAGNPTGYRSAKEKFELK